MSIYIYLQFFTVLESKRIRPMYSFDYMILYKMRKERLRWKILKKNQKF